MKVYIPRLPDHEPKTADLPDVVIWLLCMLNNQEVQLDPDIQRAFEGALLEALDRLDDAIRQGTLF